MRPGDEGAAAAIRLWWAVPIGLAVVTAIVFIAVVLPALAGRPKVPAQLVVHRSPSSAAPAMSPSPRPTRSATVVPPAQPVVRESDDRLEHSGGQRSGEPNDR